MTIPSRWIFHQHTICRFIMVHSMTISPVWFVILQCLMFDIWRLTHIFLYLLIQDYIHPNHHVIICHWLFSLQKFPVCSRCFSHPFREFCWSWNLGPNKNRPGTMLASSIPVGPAVCLGGGWTPWTPKLGALAAAKHHETIDNLCQTRPELRTLESNRHVFLLFNHRSTWKLQTCWKQSEHFYHFLAELLFLWISQVSAAVTPTTSPSGHWCPETRPFWVEMTGRRWCPSVICVSALWFMTHLTS